MESTEERRESPRTAINWPVNITVDGDIVAGETVDIGFDGLHLTCDEPIPLNDVLDMTLAPPGRSLIRVAVRVIWSDLDGIDADNRAVGMGVCFVEISAADRLLFEAALSKALP